MWEKGKNNKQKQSSKKFGGFFGAQGVMHGTSAQHGTRLVCYGMHAFCRSVFSKIEARATKSIVLLQKKTWWKWNSLKDTWQKFQMMDLDESGVDDTQTPSDAEVMHRCSGHDAGATLLTHFQYAWRGEHRVGFGNSLTVKTSVHGALWEISQWLTVSMLTHSWRTDKCQTCLKWLNSSTEMLGCVLGNV